MGSRLFPRRLAPALLVAVLVPLVSLRPAPAQEAEGDPEAVALLQQAAERMGQVQSFRFVLTTQDGTTTILDRIELESIEGAVQRPDRFRATVKAAVAFVTVSLEVVGIGDTLWIQDPLSGGDDFEQIEVENGLAAILNPDRVLLQAVELIERPAIAGEDEIDGVKATVVEGEFTPLRALALTGTPVSTPSAEEQAEAGLVLDQPLFTQLWIDEEGRLIQLAFQGRLMADEEPGIIRVLRLSEFDEPVEIVAPA